MMVNNKLETEKTVNDFENTIEKGDEEYEIFEIDSNNLKIKLDEIEFKKIDAVSLKKAKVDHSITTKNHFPFLNLNLYP